MSRIASGITAGLITAACLLAIAWSFGWVHLGAAMPAGDMDPSEMSAEPPPAPSAEEDPHAGHDPTEPMPDEPMTETPASEAVTEPPPENGMPPGSVMIDARRQQLIGVRTAPVVREPLVRTIRTVGEVGYDERLVAHIHTKISGWIESLHVDFTGKAVERGQPLLEIYSPELVSTQEEYLLALRARRELGDSAFEDAATTSRSLLEATRRRLELWDVTGEQIARLEERGAPERTLTIHSPIRGFVTHKSAYEGQFVGPRDELFTIADLTRVWVNADVYEGDLPYVRVGQRARVTLSYLPSRTFHGLVDYVYPYMAGETRTARVRIVLENPDAVLKPDMFANVELSADLGEALLVPEDAVIDTGVRQLVLVALGDGHFLPTEVQIGARADDRMQVLAGLTEGDVVVSGAAFLIDSESKLRSTLQAMSGHVH